MNRRRETLDWRLVYRAEPMIGENPIYDPRTNSLYWASLLEPALHRIGLGDGAAERWPLPSAYVGSYALYDDGTGALVAATTGIYDLQFASGEVRLLHETPHDIAEFRFNDGRCDPQGRFWVGTLPQVVAGAQPGRGYYYRIDGAGISRQLEGLTIANGTAFSPDGRTMYIADRLNGHILAFDYEPSTGTPSSPRPFIAVAAGEMPDGAAVDVRGGYWIAMFGGGVLHRYSPEGVLDRVIETPVSRPTMCAFGGAGLDRLFITTARLGLGEDQLAAEPLAGSVFATDVGEMGIPEPHFPRGWIRNGGAGLPHERTPAQRGA